MANSKRQYYDVTLKPVGSEKSKNAKDEEYTLLVQ